MTLSPMSEITISPAAGNMLTRILQTIGTLLFKVEKRLEEHFEVNTPHLDAVVRGTTFTVSVDNSGSAVHVVSGLVQVNDPVSGQSGLVRPGRTGAVTAKPGGGLKITGNRLKRSTKHAKTKPKRDKPAKTESGADGQRKSSASTAIEDKKSSARKNKKKTAKNSRKAKGPAIVSMIGITKIDISGVTNGFMKADSLTGINAGAAVEESETLADTDGGNGGSSDSQSANAYGGNGNGNGGNGNGNGNAGGGNDDSGGGNGNGNAGGGNGNGNAGGGNGNGNAGGGGGNLASGNGGGNAGGSNAGGGNPGGGNSGGGSTGNGNSGGGNSNGGGKGKK